MSHSQSLLAPYDSILLVSFGGPERPEDVVPFLRNVTAGKDIPDERLRVVGQHYYGFGGKSPINDQNRALMAALRAELDGRGVDTPITWGNRNWAPYLVDALQDLAATGARRVLCLMTSAYSSYSGCRQYRENLAAAAAQVPGAPQLDRVRHYFNLPGFVSAVVEGLNRTLEGMPPSTQVVFVTHSIPTAMNEASGSTGGAYLAQHEDTVKSVMQRVGDYPHSLVFCSRSGPPQMQWLEPDVNDHLEVLASQGTTHVVLVPIGFVSDHMEVIYDLDTEALATAERLGLTARRAPTAGVHQEFVSGLVDLLIERAAAARGESVSPVTTGALGAQPDQCPGTCCPNPRGRRPSVCGAMTARTADRK